METELTARAAGLIACHGCDRLYVAAEVGDEGGRCGYCGQPLYSRSPQSLERSAAWLLAALILYLPANLYPMMWTTSLGRMQANTILEGVVVLMQGGSYGIAVVVFVASVLIPIFKFLVLGYLLLSIVRAKPTALSERLRLYRWVEVVGRWSMLDVFVVAILAAMVQFSSVAAVQPGIAVDAFAAVVICTMLSAQALDSRLIFDPCSSSTDWSR